MFLYPLVKKKHAQLVPVYHQGPSLESCSLAFPNACDLPGLLKGLAAATPSTAPGSVSCLPSTQPSALARSPRDESPELSSFGEIPCLLYLDIPEAKGRAGQQSAGTEAWFRESLYVLSLSFTLCESTRLISHWISPSRRQNWARLSWCSTPVTLLFLTWSGSNGHVQVMPADAHPSDHMHSTKKRRRVPACWCPGFPSFGHHCRSPPPLCPTLCGPMSGRHTMLLCAPRSPGLCSNSRPVSLWGHLTLCSRSFSSPRSCYLMQSKHL